MSNIKSHFMFTKQQRSGIFALILIILTIQCVIYVVDFSSEEFERDTSLIHTYRAEVDSLKQLKLKNSQPRIFPFNPNFITDYKGYTLGMSAEELDRLHEFRKGNKWINSAKEFQKVTEVSDTLLAEISPYFKFPDWVTNPKPKHEYNSSFSDNSKPKTFTEKQDLNTASASQLKKVNGIGEALSERIVNYRSRIGGFVADVQLKEVYGLSAEVIDRVLNQFTVKSGTPITKIHINTATIEELVTIKYIDYEIAYNIIEQRTLREGFKSLDELTKVKGFPVKKSEIIELYLTFD